MNLDSVYKLLRKLPFSIRGYTNIKREVDNFFHVLCEEELSRVYPHHDKLFFISYSYAYLSNPKDWETEPFSDDFFFHPMKDSHSLLLLNLYHYLGQALFQGSSESTEESKENKTAAKVSIKLSELLVRDISLRIGCTDETEWRITYHSDSSALSIEIPVLKLIKNGASSPGTHTTDVGTDASTERKKFRDELKKLFQAAIKKLDKRNTYDDLDIVKRENMSVYGRRSYNTETKNSDSPKESPIRDLLDQFRRSFIRDEEELKKLKDELLLYLLHFHRINPGIFRDSDDDNENNIETNLKSSLEILFPVMFISIAYDCWVEYFPSVCGVIERGNNRRQYRNLGALIIAYPYQEELSIEERAFFRLISDRISSVIAAQTILKMGSILEMWHKNKKQWQLLKEFHKECLTDTGDDGSKGRLDHGGRKLTNDHVEKMKKFLEDNQESLIECGLKTFPEYCKEFYKENERIDKGLFMCIHPPGEKHIQKKNNIYKYGGEDIVKIKLSNNKEPPINVVLIHYLIEAFIKNNKGEKSENNEMIKTFTCKEGENRKAQYEDSLFIKLTFEKEIKLSSFIKSLAGERESTGMGDLGHFFVTNYNDLMISCNIIILAPPSKETTTDDQRIPNIEEWKTVLNFEEDFFLTINNNGKKSLKCKKDEYKTDNNTYKTIVYQLKFRDPWV